MHDQYVISSDFNKLHNRVDEGLEMLEKLINFTEEHLYEEVKALRGEVGELRTETNNKFDVLNKKVSGLDTKIENIDEKINDLVESVGLLTKNHI